MELSTENLPRAPGSDLTGEKTEREIPHSTWLSSSGKDIGVALMLVTILYTHSNFLCCYCLYSPGA